MRGFIATYHITYKCVKRYPDRSVVEFQWTGLMFHKPIIAGLDSLGIHVFSTHPGRYTAIIPRNTDERALGSIEFGGETDLNQSTTHVIYHMLPPPGFQGEEVIEWEVHIRGEPEIESDRLIFFMAQPDYDIGHWHIYLSNNFLQEAYIFSAHSIETYTEHPGRHERWD